VIYALSDAELAEIRVEFLDGTSEKIAGDILPKSISQSLMTRTSNVFAIYVSQPSARFLK